jgi:hypothetical protein
LANAVNIAASGPHSLALKSDGTVVAWGSNSNGEATVPVGLTNVVSLAAGIFHSLALKADGTVVAWGLDNSGQATVPAGLSNVVTIAAGGYHSLALRSAASDSAPTITTQPVNQQVNQGGSVTFTVVASGTAPLTYQWKKGGTDIVGATGANYTIANAQLADAGSYTVVVTNTAGSKTSDPAVLTIAHCADVDRDLRIGLIELTRVIELYNTRLNTVRTGRYTVQAGTEDGFAQDPAATTNQILTRYHSADSNRDGQITLNELTRVIELYNTRSGTTRTGQYHVQAGTEDGFAPGP